ncbi:MAG: phosphate/phosphite/phosphonate ABC transporter substrate-binding protein [Leptolyngbyaceae cyanobacterium MO_188.B28]|nr:phosphate/phosphite/phosphonate ABC transporter substrate-binding protein [Leptolyngbyaceae cyanobacterium MO_188.B28]
MVSNWLKQSISASLLALLSAGCSPKSAIQPIPEEVFIPTADGVIVVGDVSDEPAKKIVRYQPFADYLALQLDDIGIGIGEVEIAPNMETMADWLASGKVDVYFDSPYPAMIVNNLSEAQPILRRWKKGVEEYHTVIFTRSDSGVKTLDDLKGQMIAFEDPSSTSGYMLPLSHLVEAGLQPVEKPTAEAIVDQANVGYVFSYEDENTIQWTLTGRVTAAAVGAPDFLEIPAETRQQLTVLAETEPLPRQVVMISPTLTPEEVASIKTALLSMDESEEGQAVLSAFERTTQFDSFPEGSDQALNRMRELYELTQE